jgi:hypothetical protein
MRGGRRCRPGIRRARIHERGFAGVRLCRAPRQVAAAAAWDGPAGRSGRGRGNVCSPPQQVGEEGPRARFPEGDFGPRVTAPGRVGRARVRPLEDGPAASRRTRFRRLGGGRSWGRSRPSRRPPNRPVRGAADGARIRVVRTRSRVVRRRSPGVPGGGRRTPGRGPSRRAPRTPVPRGALPPPGRPSGRVWRPERSFGRPRRRAVPRRRHGPRARVTDAPAPGPSPPWPLARARTRTREKRSWGAEALGCCAP